MATTGSLGTHDSGPGQLCPGQGPPDAEPASDAATRRRRARNRRLGTTGTTEGAMGYEIPKGGTTPLLFRLVLAADAVTPATGKTPTVTIRKPGGSFASPAGAVTEIANGYYQVAGHATDADTAGPLALHATAAACDPCDEVYPVVDRTDPWIATATVQASPTPTATVFDVAGVVGSLASGRLSVAFGAMAGCPARVLSAVDQGGGVRRITLADALPAAPAANAVATFLGAPTEATPSWFSKTGYSLAAAGLDAVLVLPAINARQALAYAVAAPAGVISGVPDAGTGGTVLLKTPDGSAILATVVVDARGNRTTVTPIPPAAP